MEATALVTGPKDLRDQEWLDERVTTLGNGMEAARDIWANWSEGRNVGRLHPGQSAGQYIASRGLRLTLAEGLEVMPDASIRDIAAATDRSVGSVHAARQVFKNEHLDTEDPPRVIGTDGKSYAARAKPKIVGIDGKAFVPDPVAEAKASAELAFYRASKKFVFEPHPDAEPAVVVGSLIDNNTTDYDVDYEAAIATLKSNAAYMRELIALLIPLTKKETPK